MNETQPKEETQPVVPEVPAKVEEQKQVSVEEPQHTTSVRYGGFWIRLGAAMIDGILLSIILTPVLSIFFSSSGSSDYTTFDTTSNIRNIISILYFVLITGFLGTTIGKMACGLKVVDEHGNKPAWGTVVLREVVGKFVSAIGILLGYVWVAFDPEKQGWHDKIAKTHVVYKNK